MKKILATLFAAGLLLASVPAFACGGEKKAEASADDAVMTSVDGDDATQTEADGDKKTKKTKKDTKKKSADGEV